MEIEENQGKGTNIIYFSLSAMFNGNIQLTFI